MASDQMLPNSSVSSKKQQQLEAGKKRLEEFRKKKAAAKKSASSNSVHSANGDLHERKPSVSDTVQVSDGTSDVGFTVGKNEKKTTDVHDDEPGSMYVTNASPISSYNIHSASSGQTYLADEKLRNQDAPSGKFGLNAGYGVDMEQSRTFHHPEEDIHSNSNHFSNVKLEDALTNSRDDRLNDFTSTTPVKTQVSVTKSSPERSYGASFANNLYHNDQLADGQTYRDSSSEVGKSLDGLVKHGYPPVPGVSGRKYSGPVDHQASESSSSLWSSEFRPTRFSFDAVPSSHNEASVSPAVTARSRPSFLDAITVSRNSSTSVSHVQTDKADPFSSKVHPVDAPVSSDSQSFMNSSVASAGDLFRQGGNELDAERKNSFHSTKQNEDFAALEQHIEDLTQEKFSLQRALEASRVLAESLATENTALTDTYNQQGSVVNQLKSDMERLQEEIKAQLVDLEAVKTEYGNARLECSAADERAKLLASEVIALEEKALRLRSNELKLERQLENLEDEMSSQKKRISSLEKERKDLQSTIDALQEEKKLMQSMLRKAPASEKSVDIKKSPTTKKEVSTSTDDIVNESKDTTHATSNLAMPATLGESDASVTNFGLEVSSLNIPPDQMRTIQNINTLISELALEKEELKQALLAESSQTSKLKDLNKELSQKLEIQTQRLELLTSQSMVSDNNNNNNNMPARKSGSRTMVDNTPYADEGDEVVERVLGWIMKLFPGGPSKRQTKHL